MDWSSIVRDARLRAGLSQRELGNGAGTSQSAIARLEGGRGSPTLATLERVVAAAGFRLQLGLVPNRPRDPVVEAYKCDVDRTLLRENLSRNVHERLRSLMDLEELVLELERATSATQDPG